MQKRQKKHSSSAPRILGISLLIAVIGVVMLVLLNGFVDPKAPQRAVEKPISHEALAQ